MPIAVNLRKRRQLPKLNLSNLASLSHCNRQAKFLYGVNRLNDTEKELTARTVAYSQSEMTEVVLPNDTNMLGNLLGGRLMHFIDICGGIAAFRHARSVVVTAAMDHIDFIHPLKMGELAILKASVNRAFSSSMEVGVKVWVEELETGDLKHVASAYLVYVALDKAGKCIKVPPIMPKTPDELRRYEDAMRRRGHRDAEIARRRQLR
jgi:acyl-CoA hydrolase